MKLENFKDIYNNLSTQFPEKECTIKTSEKGIYDGKNYYLCLVIDKRFKDGVQIKKLKPYIWIGNKSNNPKVFKDQFGWGWVDQYGYYVDNFENPIHDEDEFVIGFIPYVNYIDDSDSKLWDIIKSKRLN